MSTAVQGWRAPSEWRSTWLPGLPGPALLVGAYALAAWLARGRIERLIAHAAD